MLNIASQLSLNSNLKLEYLIKGLMENIKLTKTSISYIYGDIIISLKMCHFKIKIGSLFASRNESDKK